MPCLSAGSWLEEKGQHDKLFHTKVKVQDRACALTIDHWSTVNVVSLELVQKLNLLKTPHPKPYPLHWGTDQFTVEYQTQVQCWLGPLSFVVLCDVIPKYLVSCHLLLGRPWCNAQGAVHSIDHTYKYYQFVVPCDGKIYNLKSMDPSLFTAWRDDRLKEKLRELEEAKKREAETTAIPVVADTAALILAPIQPIDVPDTAANHVVSMDHVVDVPVFDVQHADDDIAAEDDSNPRTVLPEGEEDDTAPHRSAAYILFLVDDAVKRRLLFLFLPRKEKIKYVTGGFLSSWCVVCLKESGWGPPAAKIHLEMTHQFEVYICLVCFIFYLGKSLVVFIFLVSFCLRVKLGESAMLI